MPDRLPNANNRTFKFTQVAHIVSYALGLHHSFRLLATKVYARLQHGTSAHDGRAELFAFGRWGTICDDDWSDNDAKVICYMLGFPR